MWYRDANLLTQKKQTEYPKKSEMTKTRHYSTTGPGLTARQMFTGKNGQVKCSLFH